MAPGVECSDYINASYVDVSRPYTHSHYILTYVYTNHDGSRQASDPWAIVWHPPRPSCTRMIVVSTEYNEIHDTTRRATNVDTSTY